MARLFFIGLALSLAGTIQAWAESPYPIRKGTKWTYQTGEKKTSSLLVESISTIQTNAGKVPVAIIRKSDGTDHIVIRSQTQWIECGTFDPTENFTCADPLVFF